MPMVVDRQAVKNTIPTFTAIVRSDVRGGYWVEFPELEGCFTEGNTLAEVRHNIADVLECWFQDEPDAPEFWNVNAVLA